MADKFLTAGELAAVLRCTPATVLAWRRRGWIRSVTASRPIVFDLDDVRESLKAHATAKEKQGDELAKWGRGE